MEHILTAQILLFIVASLAALTVAMILVQLIAFTVYAILYGRITRPRHADAVVVLGAGLNGVVMRRWQNVRVWVILASLWLLFIGALFIIVNMQGEVVDATGVAAVSYVSPR